jgi:hypothetical protein
MGYLFLPYVFQSEQFSMKFVQNERFPALASILFVTPEFELFLTGD